MIHRFSPAFTTLALLLFATAAVAQISFVFAPPNVSYTTVTTRSQSRIVDARSSGLMSTTLSANHVLEATPFGYTVTTTPISFEARQRDQVVENKPGEVLAMIPYILKLNENGEAKEAVGFERIPAIIDSVFDSTKSAMIMKRVDPKQMALAPVTEWNGRNGFRISSEGRVGETIYDQSDYSLPGGPTVKYFTAKEIVDTMRVDGALCARLRITADSNPDSLAATLGLSIQKIKDVFALTDDQRARSGSNEFRLNSRVELVWELRTGLMRSEEISRNVARTMARGGNPSTMVTSEDEQTTYTYQSRDK